jgi:hypothetical protein
MGEAVDLLAQAQEDEGAHEHLRRDCPWFRHVGEGGGDHEEIERHCQPMGRTKALVKFTADGVDWVELTPRTPEASTVHQPTVPPGGPGLFHVKGLQLPAYVQHLYKHLVGRYGKHGAYRVAVGVVKKWAQGIHPGGKGGKQGHVHADVQAAAQRNMAEWEADKATAHEHSGEHEKVKAAAAVVNPAPGPAYPGQKQTALPPVPKAARAMYTAHRLNNSLNFLAHAEERLGAAKSSKAMRAYHMMHVNNHLSHALDDLHKLVESLRLNYPAEYRELQALTKTLGLAKAEGADAKVATFAHLLQTVLYHLAHAKRHAEVMRDPDPAPLWDFNFDHAAVHTKGALEHGFKLARHLQDNYPAEARYLDELVAVEDPNTDFTGLASVAQEPGAQMQYGLWQHPAATTSPGPPLPPSVPMPTPTEVRSLVGLVPPTGGDTSLTRTIRNFIETAAVKLEKNSPLDALGSLRAAQAAVYAAHKNDIEAQPPVPWTAPSSYYRVPAAAQSSVTSAMLMSRDRTMAYRKLDVQVGALIDRIRKNYFHGVYSGPSAPLRLGTEDKVSAVDRLIELASGAGSSAGTSAGKPAAKVLPSHSTTPGPASGRKPGAKPDRHQLHVLHKEHLEHLHRLHRLHLEHLEHLAGQA